MTARQARATMMLLVAAMIWGTAFVAQRIGAEAMAPASFNGVRHLLGALVMLPVVVAFDARRQRNAVEQRARWRSSLIPGIVVGLALTGGSLLQQAGLEFTTAGKAGFITGMYLVFVPLAGGLLLGQRVGRATWVAVVLSLTGLFLISVRGDLVVNVGDLLVLGCAVFWTIHILAVGHFGSIDPLRLSVIQFVVCGVVSLVVALIAEPTPLAGITHAVPALLYTAVLSTGVAFTLQVIAQRDAPATSAAVTMSLEAVFAAIAGALFLSERLDARALGGAALMLTGAIIAQLSMAASQRHVEVAVHVPDP